MDPVPSPDRLVVEGWIEDGAAPVVYVTTTLTPTEEPQSLADVREHIVKWAKVTVSDGETSVILTGLASKRFYPQYAYTTGHMFGEAGKTYTLTVEYGGVTATASATIPASRALDGISVEPYSTLGTKSSVGLLSSGGSVSSWSPSSSVGSCSSVSPVCKGEVSEGCLLSASFTDDPSTEDYYRFFVKTVGKDSTYLPAPMGYLSDEALESGSSSGSVSGSGTVSGTGSSGSGTDSGSSGSVSGSGTVSVTLRPGNSIARSDRLLFWSPGDRVQVKFCTMSREMYLFWKAYEEQYALATVPVFSLDGNLPGNVSGAIGYFAAYGRAEYTVDIP